MNPVRKPWYRTKWGLVVALLFSPFWFVWKKSRRNRALRTLVGGAAALLVFILIVVFIGHMFKTTNNTAADGSTGSSTTGSGVPPLQGFGATLAEWEANHTEDNGFVADTAYDPTANLGNGYTDKYAAVLWIDGRALGYQMGFPDNTSLATAKSVVIREFPSDATVLWQQQNNSDSVNICYQMEVHSPTLGKALQSAGNTFVEFQTIATSDTSSSVGYYPNNVNNATLRNANYRTGSAVGGC